MSGVQPELWVDRPRDAIAFYLAAFGAAVICQVGDDEDIVAQLAVANAGFWIANTDPDAGRFSPVALGGTTSRALLVVDDPRTLVENACAAGATLASPADAEHGWLLGRITGPSGHRWETGKPVVPWPPA